MTGSVVVQDRKSPSKQPLIMIPVEATQQSLSTSLRSLTSDRGDRERIGVERLLEYTLCVSFAKMLEFFKQIHILIFHKWTPILCNFIVWFSFTQPGTN